MIDGFTRSFIKTNGVTLSVHRGGQGTPLILLHGYPQNHMCWEQVAPTLAQDFDVIIPDLRGYGDSEAPENDAANTVYSKREMACDIVGLMAELDIPKAHVLGHDRGGRVAYRMALDHPEKVDRLGIIEIVPTGDFWASWGAELAMKAYHWTFLAQPPPLPERMIGGDPEGYIDWTLKSWTLANSLNAFSSKALESYRKQARDPARIHAMCSDYRAGATFDKTLDETDKSAARKIVSPLMFLYAEGGFPAKTGDPAGFWRGWADTVDTAICESGHFAMEENPQAVLRAFLPFFTKASV